MTQHDGELEELEAAIPEPGALAPWMLLGWLYGRLESHGSITVQAWNEAVAWAEARWAEDGR